MRVIIAFVINNQEYKNYNKCNNNVVVLKLFFAKKHRITHDFFKTGIFSNAKGPK